MIFRSPERILPFTQISNKLIDTDTLSGKAKWILIYILSKPPNWQVWESDIIKHSRDGRDAVRAGIRELIAAGYVYREQSRDNTGKFIAYEYHVSEVPYFIDNLPQTEFPSTDNPTPSNTNNSNTKIRTMSEYQADKLSPYSTPTEEEYKRMVEVGG